MSRLKRSLGLLKFGSQEGSMTMIGRAVSTWRLLWSGFPRTPTASQLTTVNNTTALTSFQELVLLMKLIIPLGIARRLVPSGP